MELHLHEKRLSVLSFGPVVAVVDRGIPFEIIVRFPEASLRRRLFRKIEAAMVQSGETATDAGVITRPLQERRKCFDALGEVDFHLPASAAVVMCANRRLIAARDERGSARRANRGGHVSAGETGALCGERVEVRCRNAFFPVAGEMGRHVIHDKPEHVRACLLLRRRGGLADQ